MEDFHPMIDEAEKTIEVPVIPKLIENREIEVFIDPFAPAGPYPGLINIPLCIDCNMRHPDRSMYRCSCGRVYCSSQTQYKYKGGDSSVVDSVPYVDQVVEYSISPCCKTKVEKIN